ncbi:MAG: TIGR00268 family protein, partial [Anaerolineales bacterium]|nr:TIGR00268 family protein [Anaerolineales bacterium]
PRLEIEAAEFEGVLRQREQIVDRLKALGYAYVTLDLAGFRSGSMNEVLPAHGH